MAKTDTNSQQQHLFPPFTGHVSTWPLSSLGTWLGIQAVYHRYLGTPTAPDLGLKHVNKFQDQDLFSLQMTCFSWQMCCTDTHNKASYNYLDTRAYVGLAPKSLCFSSLRKVIIYLVLSWTATHRIIKNLRTKCFDHWSFDHCFDHFKKRKYKQSKDSCNDIFDVL